MWVYLFLKIETIIGKKERLAKKKEKKKKITENDLKNIIIGVEINNNITIVNKIDKYFSDYDLNYSFYEKLCNETLNMINPKIKQTTLF